MQLSVTSSYIRKWISPGLCETTVLSKKKEERKTEDHFNCVEFRFQISRRSIRKVQISQSNTPALLSLEVNGELPWHWLLLSLYTLTHFLC